jgi:hypothetical protein
LTSKGQICVFFLVSFVSYFRRLQIFRKRFR